MKKSNDKYDIFISYRRNGGEHIAKMVRDSLTERGYSVFFDVEALRSGDFNLALYSVIDKCSDFIIILSENALDRCVNENDWVRRELEYALSKKKNVIPILGRGFRFPDSLPESISSVARQNGINASTEFFDAFVNKLTDFLQAKPSLKIRSKRVRVISVVTALCVAAASAASVYALEKIKYPFTKAEKNITKNVLYYVEDNITRLDMMAGALDDVYAQCQRYLTSGDTHSFANQVALSLNTLSETDVNQSAASDEMVKSWDGTPFSAADLAALHEIVVNFKDEAETRIAYMEWLASDPSLGGDYKTQIIDCYRSILKSELETHAYCVNELIIPIKRQSELDEFKNKYLPLLRFIPLKATDITYDYGALESNIDQCYADMNEEVNKINRLVGNQTFALEQMINDTIQKYIDAGYTREEALNKVNEALMQ